MRKILGHSSVLTTVKYTHLTAKTTQRTEEHINLLMDHFDIRWGAYIMIRLATIIDQFETDFIQNYQKQLLPGHLKALSAIKLCRSSHSPKIKMECQDCAHQTFVPHSCGHRHCPHCQNHESQQWIERQLQKQVPAEYYMITFTLPAQLRTLAWQNQRLVYNLLFQCAWATLKAFSANDKDLGGIPGAVAGRDHAFIVEKQYVIIIQ